MVGRTERIAAVHGTTSNHYRNNGEINNKTPSHNRYLQINVYPFRIL